MKALSHCLIGLISLSILTSSCERNNPEPVDPNGNDSISNIISHYFALNNPIWVLGDDTVRKETWRLRDTVKIFLDSTISASHKSVLEEMIKLVEENIKGSGVKFMFVEDSSDFSIGIVHGSKEYLFERFNLPDYTEPPDGRAGAYLLRERFCTTLKKGFIWYDSSKVIPSNVEALIRHEFGHALGLHHAEWQFSLMQPYLNTFTSTKTLSKYDLSVLRLKYYEGLLGTTSPAYVDSCSDDNQIMYPHEEEDFKMFLEDIIRNNYN